MGIDILAFVEVADRIQPDRDVFHSYAELILPRQRDLFAAMGLSPAALYPARGVPSDCGAQVRMHYHLPVCDPEDEVRLRGEPYVPRDRADRWVMAGETSYIVFSNGARETIADPDAVRPSWLTRREILSALEYSGIPFESCSREFQVTVSMMSELEKAFPGGVRLVFWFDM